jgi:acetyl esterase
VTAAESPDDRQPAECEQVRPARHRRFLGLRTVGAVLAAVIGVLISYLALGNLIPAGSNILTVAPVFFWASIGPHLVVLSLLAVLLCVPLWLARHRRVLRTVAAALAAFSLVASLTIVGIMVNSAWQQGGSVDLVQALTLSTPSQAPDDVTSYVTVDGQAQEARVYLPEGGAQDAPVLMYVHGGGWYMGSAEQYDTTARWYASQGWYVVNVDYRLADETTATWDTAPADVACALSWTVQQAQAAGADTERLTVSGDSAGGHLAILLGWSASGQAATSTCPELGAVPVPDAVVAGYPVSNIPYTYDNGAAPLLMPQNFTRWFVGGSPSEQPERLAAVSPTTYLTPSVPPTLVIQPEGDAFIPAEGNYQTVQQAQDVGADVTLVRVPFAYHGFDSPQGSLGGQTKNSLTLNWLQGLGLAP